MKFPIAAALIAVVLVIIGLGAWWMMVPGVEAPPDLQEVEVEAEAAAPADQNDQAEDVAHLDLMAKQALEYNCQVCHEMRMITGQRLTPAQWKAEVDKMVTWGAVVSDGDRQLIIDHLARTQPADAPPPEPEYVTLASVESPEIPHSNEAPIEGDAVEGGKLYATLCAACHGPTALGGDLGPSLANRAIIGDAAAYDHIVQKGLRRMASFETVLNPQQQRDILVWLRGLPRDAAPPSS